MKKDNNSAPIGVFDSGVGGLTVVKEIIKQLPNENIVYFGDTARVPYGTKSKDTIIKFSMQNARFLLKSDVKIIVVACNTSSSIGLPTLRLHFKVPIIGVIRPGAKEAIKQTKSKKIGVIGTKTTILSESYERELKYQDRSMKVVTQMCPLFVPLAEEGWVNNKVAMDIAALYLRPLKRSKIDTLILGCTHYPLLKNVIKKVMGPRVNLVDSAQRTAKEVKSLLIEKGILNNSTRKPRYDFYVSDEPQNFIKTGQRFLGRSLGHVDRLKWNV